MKTWRVIVSPDTDPYMNMAVDEALLQTYSHNKQMPVLRFYSWKPSAVSIGISQKPMDALDLPVLRNENIVFVRRMTGGEGMYHDAEITYSIVCSKNDLSLPVSVRKSFRVITEFILDAYREFGLKPCYAGDTQEYSHGETSSFCYSTKEHFDVLVNEKKLGGNAQKRTGDIIFQHGSIPLQLDFPTIKRYFRGELGDIENNINSLSQACGRDIEFKEGIKQLKNSFAKVFSVKLINSLLNVQELDLANTLCEEKYKTGNWNYFRRTRIIKENGDFKKMQGAMRRKPSWLNKKIHLQETLNLHKLFGKLNLHTVCKEALCPNIGECFSNKVATFLILGRVCTRKCSFCAVKSGVPDKIDPDEPQRVAEAVKKLGLKHVVITSVTRDDLDDGGAGIFADTIMVLKTVDADLKVEVLVPDFKSSDSSIKKVIQGRPDIFAHNLETVPRLYSKLRQGAQYERSLDVLKKAKKFDKSIYTKSGLILGLGETESEVLDVLSDLRGAQCDFLSLEQYLAPSKKHFSVQNFIEPDKFTYYKNKAEGLGFLHVQSGPYVRSSYLSDKYLKYNFERIECSALSQKN